MAQFKKQSVLFVYNFKTLLKALSGKNTAAQSEVDALHGELCKKVADEREYVSTQASTSFRR